MKNMFDENIKNILFSIQSRQISGLSPASLIKLENLYKKFIPNITYDI
jgi:hypothetical protein